MEIPPILILDHIRESVDCKELGDHVGARQLPLELRCADLRCLDAYIYLGHLVFECWPAEANRHDAAAVGIGELSLGAGFDGASSWGWVDNRPFRCGLNGY